MYATKDDIRSWFEAGKLKGATHMLIVCDDLVNEHYPIYVMPNEKITQIKKYYNTALMQSVDDVYIISQNVDKQIFKKMK